MFKIGEAYTRKQIHEQLGGSVQSFLPTVDGEVVCACLSKEMNPNAPHEILVGNKPIVMKSAEQFSRQTTSIPVFIKEVSNEWVCVGNYTVKKITRREDVIDEYDLGGRDDIQIVLELEGERQSEEIHDKIAQDALIKDGYRSVFKSGKYYLAVKEKTQFLAGRKTKNYTNPNESRMTVIRFDLIDKIIEEAKKENKTPIHILSVWMQDVNRYYVLISNINAIDDDLKKVKNGYSVSFEDLQNNKRFKNSIVYAFDNLKKNYDPNDIHFSHSWEIHSATIAVKHTDKSVFLHHGTGIPIDTRQFFEIDGLKEGERKTISLRHNSIDYDAYFILANNRTRLFWKSDFSKLLQNLFSKWHRIFSDNTPYEENTPVIRFQKLLHDQQKYLINFIDPSSVAQDIDTERTEEYEPRKDGTVKEYYGKRYERIPANRLKAIEIHGSTCSVCGFNFSEVYGERGEGFIEVHHIKPLYQAEEAQYINPSTDLLPVCSNCHRMIHRKNDDVLSINELSELIKISR